MNRRYTLFIPENLKLIDKFETEVVFTPNHIQTKFLTQDYAPRSVILKARQQGFSSIINAVMTYDFLFVPHTYNMVVADNKDNAEGLLKRVKDLIISFQDTTGLKIDLKYDSKYNLYWERMDSTYIIGTAENAQLGRSKTISNLHLSEAAFYPNLASILAGAAQAVIPSGRVMMETTANGFNEFKTFWDDAEAGRNNFKPLFYKASDFYSPEFLAEKKKELKEKFPQEYPESAIEAFLTSGNKYFDGQSLKIYLDEVKDVQTIS